VAALRARRDERNDPPSRKKIIKINTLLANCAIFHTALE